MAYTMTNWVAGETKVNPTTMGKIEQGIKDAHDDIANITNGTTASGNASKLNNAVEDVEATGGTIVKRSGSGDIKAGAIILSNEIQVPTTTSLTDVSITCSDDQDTGLNFPSSGEMEFVSNGARRFKFSDLVQNLQSDVRMKNFHMLDYIYLRDYDDDISTGTGFKSYVRDGVWNLNKNSAETHDLKIVIDGDTVKTSADMSDSVTSTSSTTIASSKSVKSANDNADTRLPKTDVSMGSLANKVVQRDGSGDVQCRLLRQEYGVDDANAHGNYFLIQNDVGVGKDNYARPLSLSKAKDVLNINAKYLSSNANLNDYITEGEYYCPSNATVTTWTNTPWTEMGEAGNSKACHLSVQRHAGVRQVLKDYSNSNHITHCRTYERNYYSGTWSRWNRVLDDRDRATVDYNGAVCYLKADADGLYLQEI